MTVPNQKTPNLTCRRVLTMVHVTPYANGRVYTAGGRMTIDAETGIKTLRAYGMP